MKTITIKASELPINIMIVKDEQEKTDMNSVNSIIEWARAHYTIDELRWIHHTGRSKKAADARKSFAESAKSDGYDIPTIATYLRKDVSTIKYYFEGRPNRMKQ